MMSGLAWQPTASLEALRLQASLRDCIREYMQQRHVLEVTTPTLSAAAATDLHIDSVRAGEFFLHTSPEFPMKRLLAAYGVDIYQIATVFRRAEQGRRHNPEFSMLEWYRVGVDHRVLMSEMEALFEALLKHVGKPWHAPQYCRYVETVYGLLSISPDKTPDGVVLQKIIDYFSANHCSYPDAIGTDLNAALDLFVDEFVLPTFSNDRVTFLYDYPASQAALAKLALNAVGAPVAQRFEVYWGTLEIANGYHELCDAKEQRLRFENDNKLRVQRDLPAMPIDERLLNALEHGMPQCAGVAMGLERLAMLLGDFQHIDEVLAFPASRA